MACELPCAPTFLPYPVCQAHSSASKPIAIEPIAFKRSQTLHFAPAHPDTTSEFARVAHAYISAIHHFEPSKEAGAAAQWLAEASCDAEFSSTLAFHRPVLRSCQPLHQNATYSQPPAGAAAQPAVAGQSATNAVHSS